MCEMDVALVIIGALGGTAGLAGLVAAITLWVKSKTAQTEAITAATLARTEETTAAEARKKENAEAHKKMSEEMSAMRSELAAINTILKNAVATSETKDRRIAKLENENARLIQALPARAPVKKEKD